MSALGSEVGRTDGKASLLLAFNGAVLAGLASVTDNDPPTAARTCGTLAALALGAAAVLLLLVVRPRLRGDDRGSFLYWARLTEAQIRDCMSTDTRTARIRAAPGDPIEDLGYMLCKRKVCPSVLCLRGRQARHLSCAPAALPPFSPAVRRGYGSRQDRLRGRSARTPHHEARAGS
ncbi:Pycsar system effector family protein [Streptomyces rishiriensis]|uniref:Pycsar system effector family protein n=1 Tax=Streptomyces rishiriensis TaxID=68264 RepID=UPI0037A48C1E